MINKLIKDRTTRKGYVRRLDKVVSEIVQIRDARCVTCGSYNSPTAGHLFSRVAYSTRWDLGNVFRQCLSCNFRHEHDPYRFIEWYRKNYGVAMYNRLHRKYETIRDRYIDSGIKLLNLSITLLTPCLMLWKK